MTKPYAQAIPTVTFYASGPLEHSEEWASARVTIPTKQALDVLAFLGLARGPWGVCDAPDLAARVRRALWPSRKACASLLPPLNALLDLAARACDGLVVYDEDTSEVTDAGPRERSGESRVVAASTWVRSSLRTHETPTLCERSHPSRSPNSTSRDPLIRHLGTFPLGTGAQRRPSEQTSRPHPP